MKPYRSPQALLADIESVLASKIVSTHSSVLETVAGLLAEGRHYAWAGVYLTIGERNSGQLASAAKDGHYAHVAVPETRQKILVAMKLAGREYGVLAVESAHENSFGTEDRVLLERVANALARFLAGQGRYLLRKARSAAGATVQENSSAAAQR